MGDDREAAVRTAILDHLRRFPHAGDTATGILGAWLPSTGYEDAINFIVAVLETMVASGELSTRDLPDGSVLYVGGSGRFPDDDATKP